ncbi:hypothetical protein TW73_08955 [Pseudoalteromonas piscicida]|nr:hypothetical protein TW73_08955 [Pseudoalteromonas piscicida]
MQLRHLPAGTRFVLKRSRRKLRLNFSQVGKAVLYVTDESQGTLETFSCQCEVIPVIKCDGKFDQSFERLQAMAAIMASRAI